MGSIASVLQWFCDNCSYINPTERLHCERCGVIRKKKSFQDFTHNRTIESKNKYNNCFLKNFSYLDKKSNFLKRSASINTISRCWSCEYCGLFNSTVSSCCIGCGFNIKENLNVKLEKKARLYTGMDQFSSNWFPEVTTNSSNSSNSVTSNKSNSTVGNLHSSINRKDNSFSNNHSPKRQSPSMYERVKNKVSRSLSNGSVVHKLLLENSAKSSLFKRPTSLLVDSSVDHEQMQTDINKNDSELNSSRLFCSSNHKNQTKISSDINKWICSRCTLENFSDADRCEVCETPKKISDTERIYSKSNVVITVPEWDNADADPLKNNGTIKTPLTDSTIKTNTQFIRSLNQENNMNLESHGLYSLPTFRRCYSEVNTPNSDATQNNKLSNNRKSLIETDTQNNLLYSASNNTVNINNSHSSPCNPKSKEFKYSYIGITEPFTNVSNESDISLLGYNNRSLPINNELKNTDSVKERKLFVPYDELNSEKNTMDQSLLPSIKCSELPSYNQNYSDQKSVKIPLRTTESIPEISVMNSKSNVCDKKSIMSTRDGNIWEPPENNSEIICKGIGKNVNNVHNKSSNIIIDLTDARNNSKVSNYEELWPTTDKALDKQKNTKNGSHFEDSSQLRSLSDELVRENKNDTNHQDSCEITKVNQLERMWTCTKCSYAYNPLWTNSCDICNLTRSPPSLTEPGLITVTKDSVIYTPVRNNSSCYDNLIRRDKMENNFNLPPTLSLSTIVSSRQEKNLQSFNQRTDNGSSAFITNDNNDYIEKWICRKCTLVRILNSSAF